MIARAITAIIGVVIGLFATFAVFSAILGGLDSFYLLTQDACNYGSHNSPKRALRAAPENPEHPGDADEIDWTADGLDLVREDSGACHLDGDFVSGNTYLTPTGDVLQLSGESMNEVTLTQTHAYQILSGESLSTTPGDAAGIYGFDGITNAYLAPGAHSAASAVVYQFFSNHSTADSEFTLNKDHEYGVGLSRYDDGTHTYYYVVRHDSNVVDAYNTITPSVVDHSFTLPAGTQLTGIGLYDVDDVFYTLDHNDYDIYRYDIDAGTYNSWSIGEHLSPQTDIGVGVTGGGELALFSEQEQRVYIAPDYRNASVGYVSVDLNESPDANFFAGINFLTPFTGPGVDPYVALSLAGVYDNKVYLYQFTVVLAGGGGEGSGHAWIPAEDVFTAQERLVTLLAVIAAIGMPIGAMTAIVFFGQAVLSSGMSGQGASQVLVAIAAVVIILVSIQMFQQFAGFLGTAFDAVNGDRFVVFDETLGSLAETIAEFWGVLAFAGFINIATIVWRNYSGNFSIGGNQGGL